MTSLARASKGATQTPWQRRDGESAEDAAMFWLWRYGLVPLDIDLATKYDWTKRADWLDALDAMPTDARTILRDGMSYALTSAFIAQKERALRACADPAWAAENHSTADWLALVARADEIVLPDPGREIDWEALVVQGVITAEELELRVLADELDRRLGL